MTCISDSGFFYSLNIFNSNFVFLKLKKALVSTRFLICIRIPAGCSSSLRCPCGQQQWLGRVHSVTCVHLTCEESKETLSSRDVGTKGCLSPGNVVLARGWPLHPGRRWEESWAWNLPRVLFWNGHTEDGASTSAAYGEGRGIPTPGRKRPGGKWRWGSEDCQNN